MNNQLPSSGTTPSPFEHLLDLCYSPRPSGNEGWYSTRCPGHTDTHASLSLREDERGGVILKCHAGCTRAEILQGFGLQEKDLHPRNGYRPMYRIRSKLELIDLAADKLLPWQYLFSLGIQDEYDWHGSKAVQIPYYTKDGQPHTKMRVRIDVAGKGSRWDEDTPGEIIPYGLHKLDMALASRYLLIGEGESDAWTCWLHRVPYLGIPGATNEDCLQGKDLEGIPRVYIIQEPDKAGQGFYKRVHRQLRATGYKGRVYALPFKKLTGHKDPNALHKALKGQGFKEILQQACEHAISSGDEMDRARAATPLHYRLRKLQEEKLPDMKWIVPDILPEGLTLLCGKPKLGKSWLLLSLLLAVSSGGVALGNIPVEQGEVFYLSLEDNKRRLQKRTNMLLSNELASDDFYYAVNWPRMNEGGLEALEEWILEHPKARVIGIDTWAKFMPLQRGGSQKSVYNEDYNMLGPLQELASRHNVSIVLVHHMRKQESDDPLDMISGSTAMQGAVDGFLLLYRKRGETDARLYVTGRDIEEEQEMMLTFQQECATWTLRGDVEPESAPSSGSPGLTTTPERQAILNVIKEYGPITVRNIADRLEKNLHTTRCLVASLRKEGKIHLTNNTYTLVSHSEASYPSYPNHHSYPNESNEGNYESTVLTREDSPDIPSSESSLVTPINEPVEPVRENEQQDLTSLTRVTTPHEENRAKANYFYSQFCSNPGYTLRLRPDGQIGIGVPESVSDAEYEHIVEQVQAQGNALRQVLTDLKERKPN